MHTLAGHSSPTACEAVKAILRGIKRTFRHRPARKAPATSDRVAAMTALTGDGPRGLRDRALLLLGFAGAFRRSELVALNLEDVEFSADGLRITIRKSKTDQQGDGAIIAIARGSFAHVRSTPCTTGSRQAKSPVVQSSDPSARKQEC